KKRWSGLVIGVIFLVFLSMLVPLAFLLGLHNGFHPSGNVILYNYRSQAMARSVLFFFIWISLCSTNFNLNDAYKLHCHLGHQSADVFHQLISHSASSLQFSCETCYLGKHHHVSFHLRDLRRVSQLFELVQLGSATVESIDESGKICELKYGSYCLWREEHREEMRDSMVKKLKDQLFVARAYYPTIAKLPAQNKLSRELKQNIQELERVFSESTTDADLPPQIEKKLQNMQAAISRAKQFPVDCNNVDKKLRQIYDMTEDEANFHMKQSSFLYQLAVQTMPKSLHCLSMRLTVEYFKSSSTDMELSLTDKYFDPALHHYVLFSNNVLASSVVINSTVMHATDSGNQVFHVLTDGQNYFAMKLWFFRNTYKEATVEVLNIEHLNLKYDDKATPLHLFLPVEFRVSSHSIDNLEASHKRMQYISIFSHLHYLLPDIFRSLEKVLVLDDDVVVQRDLSALWSLKMGGKVNGAVQSCSVRLGQLKSYLGETSFDKSSCAWMSGLNIIDLARWRELDLTETYQRLVRGVSLGKESFNSVALRASLLTFQDLVYTLDSEWVLSGLGHDYGLHIQTIKKAAVLHYNGNMKPWIELGIPKYKYYWKKFINREDQFLSECNVNP
ncbi:Glyco_transf_8 domain-containing protein, partial [Cephalotus follicularis]